MRREVTQDQDRQLDLSGRQGDPGEGDHRVTAPVGEPRVPGNHRMPSSRADHQKLVGGSGQRVPGFVVGGYRRRDAAPAGQLLSLELLRG